MRRPPVKLASMLRQVNVNNRRRNERRWRLSFESLEDRCLMAAGSLGTIGGTAFIDANHNGVVDPGEASLPGVTVNLTGTTSSGQSVNQNTTTNALGGYQFISLLAGTYTVTIGPVQGVSGNQGQSDVFSNQTLAGGQTLILDAAFSGLGAQSISLRQFLTTSTPADNPATSGTPGQGTLSVFAPTVSTAISAVSAAKNSSPTSIDLAGHFSDTAAGNSMVSFDVTGAATGSLNVQLLDQQTPQTVANFLDYVKSGAYDSSVFSRLVSKFVLQGGALKVANDGTTTSLSTIPTQGTVPNEFSTSNTTGTLAMAQTAGNPNSATDQFFFNVADNSGTLDPQKFTVFGKVADPASTALLNQLAALPTQNMSTSPASSANPTADLQNVPLVNYNGTPANFPATTPVNDFLVLKDVKVTQQNDFLTYSVVSNSNPTLVTPSINNEKLTLTYANGQTGTATITVRATNTFGITADTTFTVTVS